MPNGVIEYVLTSYIELATKMLIVVPGFSDKSLKIQKTYRNVSMFTVFRRHDFKTHVFCGKAPHVIA